MLPDVRGLEEFAQQLKSWPNTFWVTGPQLKTDEKQYPLFLSQWQDAYMGIPTPGWDSTYPSSSSDLTVTSTRCFSEDIIKCRESNCGENYTVFPSFPPVPRQCTYARTYCIPRNWSGYSEICQKSVQMAILLSLLTCKIERLWTVLTVGLLMRGWIPILILV